MIVIFILCGIFPVDSFISEDSVAIILQKCYNNSKCDGMETGSDIILLENKKYLQLYICKNITCYLDDIHGKTVKLNNASDKIVWTISNKKVASVYGEDNSVTVYPKNPGTCYLKAKCGRQSFRCKVKVKGRKYVYAGGYIYSYNTRTNTFLMKFKNCSDKVMRIKSSDAIAVDSDYAAYDRKLKLSGTISIKPGKVRWLKFKVVGNLTWYNVDDFCIN